MSKFDVLKVSDLAAGVTNSGYVYLFEGGLLVKKSVAAVVISAAARLIAENGPDWSMGQLSELQKNELNVGVLSALTQYTMNKRTNVYKAFFASIGVDLISEFAFKLIGMEHDYALFSMDLKKKSSCPAGHHLVDDECVKLT